MRFYFWYNIINQGGHCMKKVLVVLFLVSVIFTGCSPKDGVKDGTHNDDGVVHVEVVHQFVM